MRAYELLVIIDIDVDEPSAQAFAERIAGVIATDNATVAKTDFWGRRQFAYEINHKREGTYVLFEITTENPGLPETDRFLRLADEIVRHKIVRLPDAEAARRGYAA